jgi:hypothetical protein
MSAQPVHEDDPRDPQVILERLPEQARPAFLEEYRAAVDAAHEPTGYRALQQMLQQWSVLTVAYAKPDFEDRYEQIRDGVGEYVTLEEVVARRHAPS